MIRGPGSESDQSRSAGAEPWFAALRERAAKEPLSVDIADFSDEFCAGFLAGQVNGLDAVDTNIAEYERVIALCAADTTAADLAQAMEFLKTALVQIIDLAQDEPGGLNYASRASRIAREALGWERE